eukprot:TRINITY_DN17004_c0_g2_i1.p1 TRINITY_DN17004_c0_g2~~TRINITY_DN17004_c0_g2_i1.p1  ORF type:complete len:366 (+),score=66.35 TRINITY_DN17004_c0_g2_i1:54-1100(+)
MAEAATKTLPSACQDLATLSGNGHVVLQGWLHRRGPTATFQWRKRWAVLAHGRLDFFENEDCKTRKSHSRLRPETVAMSLKARCAPGDSAVHSHQRPFGFVLDLEPKASQRQFVFVDASNQENLDQWLQAIPKAIEQAKGEAVSMSRHYVQGVLLAAAKRQESQLNRCRKLAAQLICKHTMRYLRRDSAWVARALVRILIRKALQASMDGSDIQARILKALDEGDEAAAESLLRMSPQISSDKEAARNIVKRHSSLLQHLPAELRADRDVVLDAIRNDASALAFADDSLKSDRGVAWAAVQRDGNSLEHVSADLKADREIVLAAVINNADALQHASEELKADESMTVF